MKTIGLLWLLILLVPACRKSASSPAAQSNLPAKPLGAASPAISENQDAEDAAEAVNQRTRPLPRPPDKQHPKPEFSFAETVPGKAGYVFSPFNNKIVDVRNIPPGTLVADPTYPSEEKKIFRVP